MIDKNELDLIYPANNFVIVRPLLDTRKVQTKSGVQIYTDNTYKPEHHSRSFGEVVAVPKQLIFDRKQPDYSMEWETNMGLKVGDKILINYLAGLNADKYYNFKCGDELLFLVPYERVYMALRDDEPIMMNGYVLVELEQEDKKSEIIEVVTAKKKVQIGIIRHLHRPNLQYLSNKQVDEDFFQEGDRVLLAYKNYRMLEDPLHKVFDHDRDYIVLQRFQIAARLPRERQ